MRMFREEVFGPVAQLHVVPDLDAALEWARKVPLGAHGSIEVRPTLGM